MKNWLCLITLFFILPPVFTQNCNNWAKIDSTFWMQIGNLNVTGDKITVEAMFNKTKSNSGSQIYSGDLVTKHLDSNYANYALRPNSAEITTKNGNFETPDICNSQLNKKYHVAMVYDGQKLKFYRNGFLMSEIACTGNLYQSNYLTAIGFFSNKLQQTNGNFTGYINEVRIWNVARSQDDIKKYMNQSLPNPASQTGLLAYYTFDDLKNKQGNAQWDASVEGVAQINQTNPACHLIADSCQVLICNLKAGFTYQKTVCDPKTIQFNDTTLYADSISWDFGNGETATDRNPIIKYADYGKYIVHLYAKTFADCTDTATDTINVNIQKDSAVITGNTSICEGSSIQLNAINGLKYCWSPAKTLSDSSIQNPVAKPTTTTTYYLNILALNDMPVIQDSIKITVSPLPNIQTSNDTTVCGIASVQLNASGASSYTWMPSTGLTNTNIANPIASPATTTTYTVKGIDVNGCANTDSVNIIVNSAPQFSITPGDTSMCTGDSVLLTATGGDVYNWSPAQDLSNISSATAKASPNQDVTYSVPVPNISCKITEVLKSGIIVKQLPVVMITKSNDVDCMNYESHLNATGGINYSWFPATYISATNIPNPVVNPPADTKYFVTALSSNGCKNQDSVLVHSSLANTEEVKFEVANAFTPNNDGLNDCFSVKYWGSADAFDMSIYNRWGQVVFHSNNINNCWDGTYNGVPQPTGAYVYVITATTKCSSGVLHKKGMLMLVR